MPIKFTIPKVLHQFSKTTNKDQVSTSTRKGKGKALQVGISIATCVRKNHLATLPNLRVEIIELILDILTREGFADLFALRLVCNRLNYKTYSYFGSNCFVTVRTDFSRGGFQKFQALSEIEQIRPHVQCLAYHDDKLTRGFARHSGSHKAQLSLLKEITKLLLQNFINCRSFTISCACQEDRAVWPAILTHSDKEIVLDRVK